MCVGGGGVFDFDDGEKVFLEDNNLNLVLKVFIIVVWVFDGLSLVFFAFCKDYVRGSYKIKVIV